MLKLHSSAVIMYSPLRQFNYSMHSSLKKVRQLYSWCIIHTTFDNYCLQTWFHGTSDINYFAMIQESGLVDWNHLVPYHAIIVNICLPIQIPCHPHLSWHYTNNNTCMHLYKKYGKFNKMCAIKLASFDNK